MTSSVYVCTILYLLPEFLLLCSVRFFFLRLEVKVVTVGLLQIKALSKLLLKSSPLLLPLPLLLLFQVQLCADPTEKGQDSKGMHRWGEGEILTQWKIYTVSRLD